MAGKTLIIGAGSTLGRMLRKQWGSSAPGLLWVSRGGPLGGWTAEAGPPALRKFMQGADMVVCLAGATPGFTGDFSLNEDIARAVVTTAGPARRVFLVSTMAVYGAAAGPHAEDGPVAPEAEYGRSKLQAERVAAQVAAESGARLTVLRLGNVVGADMLFGNMAAGRPIVLDRFADGRSPARSYLDPERLAAALSALIAMARAGADLPAVLNLASDPPLEMAALLRAAGVRFETRDAPDTARACIAMDLARARALLPMLAAPVDAAAAVAAWQRVEAMA